MGNIPAIAIFCTVFALAFSALCIRRRLARRTRRTAVPVANRMARLWQRLRAPEWRKYGVLLFAGKLAGLAALLGVTYLINPDLFGLKVFAADPALKGNDIVNPINTVWTLVAAFLVFGMQVGFTMLEAGFCRSRETVNVLMPLRTPFLCIRLLVHVFPWQRFHRSSMVYVAGSSDDL